MKVLRGFQGVVVGAMLALMAGAEPQREPVPVGSPAGSDREAKQPQAAVDAQGRVFVAYGTGNTIRVAVSNDGGRSFDAPVTVGQLPSLALGMRRGPRIAATEDAVVVTAIEKGEDANLFAWRSTDAGRTWTGPTRLNSVDGSAREGLHGMATAPDGQVFCTWLDLRHGRMEIYGILSRDGGASWEDNRLVYRSPERAVCTCCHPSAAFGPEGALYVMWRNDLLGNRDMYVSRSNDGGTTFGPAVKLGQGTWTFNACPMDGGSIAVGPGGEVETVWMRDGRMFAAAPGETERLLGLGRQGWGAIGPKGLYAAWLVQRPGKLMVQRPGQKRGTALAEAANDPVVAAGPNGQGPVVVVWEQTDPPAILASRLDQASSD